jgi:hypothetical protein
MPSDTQQLWWPDPRDGHARITLLGTHHFHTPGNDAHGLDLDDPLAPARQQQLRDLRDRLTTRSFDHVAVEVPHQHQDSLSDQYQAIRDGAPLNDESAYPDGYAPLRSEAAQIGFRVADTLNLETVHAVDSRPDPPDTDGDWTIPADPDEVPYPLIDPQAVVDSLEELIRESTYVEALREQNKAEALREKQRLNIAAAASSSRGGDHGGAAQTGFWYERNARLVENLRQVTGPNEETLFVVGASHVIPVKQLAQATPATCPRPALPLLNEETDTR